EIMEVPVTDVVTSSLRNTDSESTRVDVEIEAEVRIRVDPVRIQQALTNLLTNAVRYGGGQALLTARVTGADVVFEMHDNGTGVPTRYEAVIWHRFERGANRLNSTNPGLGIGLAIVEAIAQSHGGSASYRRSERLGGACFSIVLPGCVVPSDHSSPKVDVYR
ncbi:MAG: ATP-binding protein, partial [Acidimicrobiia bacterium]|nr:ATP-binding protein [Acidimicrobiia bacterium]